MTRFRPHSLKQQEAIFSTHKITCCITGIQWGKSTVGAVWLKRLIHADKNPLTAWLVTAPTYKIMEQATLPAFLAVMQGCGVFNDQKKIFTTHWGSKVYFRTGTEPDSVVGITNVGGIWGDEAGKYSLYFWDNIQARASLRDAPIMLTTSPYTLNWLFKDFIKKRKDFCKLIGAESIENPYFSKADWERRKATMDPRRFNAVYGGNFEKLQGLVYGCFDEDLHSCEMPDLSRASKIVAGVDWGYTSPCAMVVRALMPDRTQIQVSETYQTQLTISDKIRVAKAKKLQYNIELFIADPSEPSDIEEFNRAGLPCVAANNDIHKGIQAHYELIKSGRYRVVYDSSPHTIDELSLYHYPEPADLAADDDLKEDVPVKQNDHAMDANRYATVYLLSDKYQEQKAQVSTPTRANVRGSPWMPARKNKNKQTEVW
jgi:PBSX family phage terminase large subunit